MPEVLVLHLKRFQHQGDMTQRINKTVSGLPCQTMHCSSTAFGDVQVTFPVEGLDMSAHRTASAAAAGTTSIYDLYAVIQHSGGSLHRGHYTAVTQHPRTRIWHCYNDTNVTQVSLACAM